MAAQPSHRMATADSGRILDSLSTSVLIVDRARSLLFLNVSAETLFGVSRNQVRGRPLAELLEDSAVLDEVIDRAATTSRPFSRRELQLRPIYGDGELVVDCTVAPYEESGAPGAVLIEISDATQHQRITRETALLTQIGGSRLMIRQLAHEIKNPLGGLRGAAQLLARQLDDASMREYTTVIISEADRLVTLVDTLLGPGHLPRKKSINIHELLQHVGHLLGADAPPGVVIDRDYDPSLPPLNLDRDLIIQAMLNLGKNAMQALAQTAGRSGRLVLRTRALTNVNIGARRHRLVASVQFEDNGPGVPEHLRDTLFYPLVTGRADGTGLGLAVAQDLVSRHDGLIEFESRPGLTIFTILLPFHVTDHTSQAP
ncbi:PAS domain-containing sensor histidine kinase [Steroidobacter agaridevorans]|uniref:Sensory histidine kinase/phosphatase NtrB n=1 Tax=Steroidobacter agaridevorans TaxID=2695856 RepID=A0A829Y6W2_9GAMM|nr:nitrogen regulation protein NR(II) [Steroidobacter agaridevorans]GFE78342.1 PAS domain-containing sensor histidine kinase [Steroidobacter agaridevorans]GFE89726.1 PAS domain-containing sensor histidine kinase [Steroidobacter agaridevorans]